MVNGLLRRLQRQPALEPWLTRLAGRYTTWPADDFSRFLSTPEGAPALGVPAVIPLSRESPQHQSKAMPPGAFEMRFMRLQAEGRFDEMWEMIAEDAQRAWGSREEFMTGMPRLDAATHLLNMQVVSAALLDSWTDQAHQRSYRRVARVVMRYSVREHSREWTLDRQVHLVSAEDGWKTLCYPMTAGSAASR